MSDTSKAPPSADPTRAEPPPASTIDLFPEDLLRLLATPDPPPEGATLGQRITVPGPHGAHELALPGPLDFPAATGAAVEKNRRLLLGPDYSALACLPRDSSTFDEQIAAEGALSLIPAALLGSLARPVVDFLYGLIDRLPAAIRRPFEKELGLLIDTALAAAAALVSPLAGATVDRFHRDGSGLPPSVALSLRTYSQMHNSCGETAAAMILKGAGLPVSLAGVDTQLPFAPGTNLLVDEEFRKRGLTAVNGPGDLARLKAFLASGYPVMVSIGWEGGGGHLTVVTGYDDATRRLTLRNFHADGTDSAVPYDEFDRYWVARGRYMTAVIARRDPRLDPLREAGTLRRDTPIHEGLSLSDLWVTEAGKVFVEGAWRYCAAGTDLTVRVKFNSAENGLARQLGGGMVIRQRIAPGWTVDLTVEKLSVRGADDTWQSYSAAPVAIYGGLSGPGFEIRAGGERGAFQASAAAHLGRLIAGLGLRANLAVEADGSVRLTALLAGTF
ncbi:MAG: hypothetical protein EXR72_26290 [Myxococcales bacterium]|nr:hypothetical protein [Myxococcales bacterium]